MVLGQVMCSDLWTVSHMTVRFIAETHRQHPFAHARTHTHSHIIFGAVLQWCTYTSYIII